MTCAHGGCTLAYVYDSGLADADAVGREALAPFGSTNGLDPAAFPSLAAMERELVSFARPLFHAPDGAAGTVTSGGTESILLAVQTARDARSDVERPVMVAPSTVHGRVPQAAHYFGVELVTVDVDPSTMRAVPAAMVAAMDAAAGRLVLVAMSALPRRRLHRRLGAAVGGRGAGRGLRRARRVRRRDG